MTRTYQILLAFLLGQVLQVVLHGFVDKLVSTNPLVVCIVVGLLVTSAFYVGILLANREQDETDAAVREVFADEIEAD